MKGKPLPKFTYLVSVGAQIQLLCSDVDSHLNLYLSNFLMLDELMNFYQGRSIDV